MIFKLKDFFLIIFFILLQSCSGGRIGNFFERSFDDLDNISQKDLLIINLEKNDEFSKKESNQENKITTKKLEKKKNVLKNKKDSNSQKIKKIKNPNKKRKIDFQSYKLILILKNVDPKDPIEELSTILRNSEVDFEIEKIERILDSKNKSMNKN